MLKRPPEKSVTKKLFKNRRRKPVALKIIRHQNRAVRVLLERAAGEDSLLRNGCVWFLTVVLLGVATLLKLAAVKYVGPAFAVTLYVGYRMLYSVRKESLLVVKSLGYQIEVQYAGFRIVRYIPWEHVKYIFINEVISKQRVIFILSMCTKDTADSEKLIPLFLETMPRLDCLQPIYQSIQELAQ